MDQPPREKTLAGQPQEPWQSYSPQSADDQDTYGYPQSSGQGAHAAGGQAYARSEPPAYGDEPFLGRTDDMTRRDLPVHGQPAQEQAYPGAAAYPGSQGYPGSQDFPGPPEYQVQPDYAGQQEYQGAHSQAAPQWQAEPGTQQPARAAGTAKGFVASLFDFRFESFVTPKIMKALYVLYTVWMVIWAVFFLLIAFFRGTVFDGFFVLIIADPIFLLLTLGGFRVILELFMVIHRMHDDLKAIRERADVRG
jgi:Domain of unknown function (DUF4282)